MNYFTFLLTEAVPIDIWQGITDGVTHFFEWTGLFITALLTQGGALAPLATLVFLSIAGSVIFFGVKLVKGLTWGA